MGGDVAERAPKPGKQGSRRPKRRLSIRLDMTPMVDIAFLLLIFYMVSTVFAMPQAMEINLPPIEDQNEQVEIKESNLLTVRVDQESRYWWNLKRTSPENLPLMLPSDPEAPDSVGYTIHSDSLRGLLKDQNQANSRLSTLVLIHRDASYVDMVNILDEIDLLERSWNAYQAETLGKDIRDLVGDERFSYRYAIGEWEERDDRIIEASAAATASAQEGGQ